MSYKEENRRIGRIGVTTTPLIDRGSATLTGLNLDLHTYYTILQLQIKTYDLGQDH